jgi:hypothetical protein
MAVRLSASHAGRPFPQKIRGTHFYYLCYFYFYKMWFLCSLVLLFALRMETLRSYETIISTYPLFTALTLACSWSLGGCKAVWALRTNLWPAVKSWVKNNWIKIKTVPLTGRGGLWGRKMLKIPYCLDNQLTDGGGTAAFVTISQKLYLFF